MNGHIESRYSVKTGKWTEPAFVEDPYLRIHGMAPGLNYGAFCLVLSDHKRGRGALGEDLGRRRRLLGPPLAA